MSVKKEAKELERKLRDDPDNLPLRLRLAAALRDAGRSDDAIALYRSVAVAYHGQGRLAQAVAVCRSVLEIEPADPPTHGLLGELEAMLAAAPPADAAADVAHERTPTPNRTTRSRRPSAALAAPEPPELPPPDVEATRRRAPSVTLQNLSPPAAGRIFSGRAPVPRPSVPLLTPTPLPPPLAAHEVDDSDVGEFGDEDTSERPLDPDAEPLPEPLPPPPLIARRPRTETDEEAPTRIADGIPDPEPEEEPAGQAPERPTQPMEAPPIAAGDAEAGGVAVEAAEPAEPARPAAPPGAREPADAEGRWPEEETSPRAGKPAPATIEPTDPGGRPGASRSRADVTDPGGPPRRRSQRIVIEAEVIEPQAEETTGDESAGPLGVRFDRPFAETVRALAPDGAAIDTPLSIFSELPQEALVEMMRRMQLLRFGAGAIVLREGDPGNACYVIAEGVVRVLKANPADPQGDFIEVARLGPGSIFGEFALLADRRRHATVQAVEACELYEIPRRLLRELAATFPDVGPALEHFFRERLLSTLLATAPFFRPLPEERRGDLLARFQPRRSESGEQIVREGESAGGLYLIVLGAVDITKRVSDRRSVLVSTLGEGSYFGEMSLLRGGVACASVTAVGPTELAVLPPREFYEVVAANPVLWEEVRREANRREVETTQIVTGESGVV